MFSFKLFACGALMLACTADAESHVNEQDRHDCDVKAFFGGARSGSLMDVKACLLGGTDVEMRNAAGCTAVHAAATNKHLEVVKYLHSKGATMDSTCFGTGTTPVMQAAKFGDVATVRYLVDEGGADANREHVNRDTGETWTALTYAAFNGHLEVVKYLHKLEVSVHPKPHEKWTGSWLMWAAASGEADITDDLADGNEPGGTTLEAKDEHGFTAAFWAAQMGNMDALKVLVKRGADLTVKSNSGLTMLMAAAFWGREEATDYLIKTGVHSDQHDTAGWTAIMWAAANGQLGTVKALHKAGVDLTSLSRGNWNVLMVAVHSGNPDVVTYLLENGASPTAENHFGQSAITYAESLANSSQSAGDGDMALAFQKIAHVLGASQPSHSEL